jgi:hypothetical protein
VVRPFPKTSAQSQIAASLVALQADLADVRARVGAVETKAVE